MFLLLTLPSLSRVHGLNRAVGRSIRHKGDYGAALS